MNCKDIEQHNIVEEYLRDRLTESERDEFEKHYFECESCFSQLQTGLTIEEELSREALPQRTQRGAFLHHVWNWTPAVVAVILLFGAGIWWYSAQKLRSPQQASSAAKIKPEVSQPASPETLSWDELARVEPPPYTPLVLRGVEDRPLETFRKAMQHYLKGDYAKAIPGVRAAVKANPQNASFNFYLGACYLMSDQADSAIESFRTTVSLGNLAYSEPAHFYLAKAYLRKKDMAAAEDELQTTIRLRGNKEAEAGEILRQLRK